jgi:hypothetical protein
VEPNAPIYFYKFSTPAASDILFTTRFTIADAQGNFVPATQTETATNGDVVLYGTGALSDPTQGDQPPVVGTGSASSTTAAPSQTTNSQGFSATRVSTNSGTGTSTAATTSRTNAASQTYAMSSMALGALGALVGALFL